MDTIFVSLIIALGVVIATVFVAFLTVHVASKSLVPANAGMAKALATVAFRIVVVNYAAILFILGSFRPLSVTDFMWVHFLSSPDQRFGFACLAAA